MSGHTLTRTKKGHPLQKSRVRSFSRLRALSLVLPLSIFANLIQEGVSFFVCARVCVFLKSTHRQRKGPSPAIEQFRIWLFAMKKFAAHYAALTSTKIPSSLIHTLHHLRSRCPRHRPRLRHFRQLFRSLPLYPSCPWTHNHPFLFDLFFSLPPMLEGSLLLLC